MAVTGTAIGGRGGSVSYGGTGTGGNGGTAAVTDAVSGYITTLATIT